MKLTEYKCPNCGAVLQTEEAGKTAACPYCGAKFAVEREQELTAALVANTETIADELKDVTAAYEAKLKKRAERDADESKMFRRFKIKDIVFLAIITACTLVTSAIMPLFIHVPVFGIIQLGLGLQFSIFPVIGLMKVRKAGSMTIMGIFIALFLVMMVPAYGAHRRVCGCGGTHRLCNLP